MSVALWVSLVVVLAIIVGAVVAFVLLFPVRQYFKCWFAGAKVSLKVLMSVKMSRARVADVVSAYIFSVQSGFPIPILEVLAHQEAGGNVEKVVRACVSAKESGIDLSLAQSRSLDLSGRDPLEAVQTCLVPKQVETGEVVAIAKDGIEVKLKLRLTLKSNLKRFLGGASESTIISRVEEAATSAIGSAQNYSVVIENPDAISECVQNQDLDSGTMYELMSVDVVSASVGSNVGARLAAEKAEADKKIQVAKSEEARQALLVKEQEAKIKTQEMKTEWARQEAEVPKALVDALKKGKLSTMDYLNIENIKSDTKMRNAITESSAKGTVPGIDNFDF